MRHLKRTLAVTFAAGVFALSANATTIFGSLYYTTFQNSGTATSPSDNVFHATWSYDNAGAGSFSILTNTRLDALQGADGIIFAPNGNLLIGGQLNGKVYEVSPTTPDTVVNTFLSGSTSNAAGAPGGAFHLSRDTHGTTTGLDMYVASGYGLGSGANMGKMTLAAGGGLTGAGSTATGSGIIDTIEWVPSGGGPLVFFTEGDFSGVGSAFGTVNLTTWAKSYICGGTALTDCSSHPAHSLSWDPYTNTLIVWGSSVVSQYDPVTSSWLPGTKTFSGLQLDQGEVDGLGHLFIADNITGRVLFMDLTSGNVGAPQYFTPMSGPTANFLHASLDDLVVPNAADVPEPNTTVLLGGALIALGWMGRRRARRKADQ